jgi:hypothetical protein
MEPGIYTRTQVPDYDAIDAINYSSLKMLLRSPKHYRHYLDNGSRETRDMFKGTTSHVAILEPERFAIDYAVFPGKAKRGAAWESFKTEHADVAIIKAGELTEAIAMRDAVRADPLASAYLSNGRHEVTLVWIDQETGLKLKGRVDWLRNDNVLVDVKTARDATPFFFSGSVAKLLYHVQCAMYLDAVETITGQEARFVVLAIEKSAPYDVVPYAVPEPVLGVGRDEYRRLLRLLIECRKENRWPGISNGFELQLNLPAYAMPDESDLDALGLEQ